MMKLTANTFNLQSNLLRLTLAIRKLGFLPLSALILVFASITYFTVGVALEQKTNRELLDIIHQWNRQHQGNEPKAVDPQQVQGQRFQTFAKNLGNSDDLENYLKTVFALARIHDVALPDGEYKIGGRDHDGLMTYEVALPIKGTYPAIQAFCEDVLLNLPHIALDSIQFHRESIALDGVDAKIRLTMYLRSDPNNAALLQSGNGASDNTVQREISTKDNQSIQDSTPAYAEKRSQ